MKRNVILVISALLLVPLSALHAADTPKPDGRPNILFILTDDQNPDTLGCFGGQVLTPTLDNGYRTGFVGKWHTGSPPVLTIPSEANVRDPAAPKNLAENQTRLCDCIKPWLTAFNRPFGEFTP